MTDKSVPFVFYLGEETIFEKISASLCKSSLHQLEKMMYKESE